MQTLTSPNSAVKRTRNKPVTCEPFIKQARKNLAETSKTSNLHRTPSERPIETREANLNPQALTSRTHLLARIRIINLTVTHKATLEKKVIVGSKMEG